MRQCRNPQCGQVFTPLKPFYVYCSWTCRVAHVGEHYEDRRGWQRERHQSYDRGYWDGARARPVPPDMPQAIWKGLLLFSHPDRWQAEPGLLPLATEITRWLLDHRPVDATRH
jgi:hypothetical protein